MDPTIIIVGIVVVLAVIGGIAFVIFSRRDSQEIDDRLERIDAVEDFNEFLDAEEEGGGGGASSGSVSVLDESRKFLDPFNDYLADREMGKSMRRKLARADIKLTVGEFAASHVVSSAGFFTVSFLTISSGDILTSTIFGMIGFFFPRIYVSRKVNQRLHAFEAQLADTLGLWVNALRSGYSVLQAMEAIARDSPEPTQLEFERVVREAQLGIDLPDALAHMLERLDSPDFDLVITAVNIQREVGGNLAEILEVISHTIRERIKLKGEIRVLTSQGRITGYVISFLPIALALFLNVANPGYVGLLFSNRSCGWPMLGLALALIGIGTAVIQKIVDIEI